MQFNLIILYFLKKNIVTLYYLLEDKTDMEKKRIIATCALPYANGGIHLGHMLEHIQADIWVRFQRMLGNEIFFVCASDAHGTPIMIKAESMGIKPEEMVEKYRNEHIDIFKKFNISYDNYYTTHSPENKKFSEEIYLKLKENNHIESKKIQQLYDEKKQMFLPDRYVKGTCPKCNAEDQYGDNCDKCGATYSPVDLINPKSILSDSVPVLKETEHLFFKLSKFENELENFFQSNALQPEIVNKLKEWFKTGLEDWCISRDAPYFGFEIPDAKNKFFYVWLDAPIGYMSSFYNYCESHDSLNFDEFWSKNSTTELEHFIGKDIINFHGLFWPAMLSGSEKRLPNKINVHGFVNVNGEKMSKSKGTFITADDYLNNLDVDALRYYYASKLNNKIDDLDLNFTDFVQKINTDIVNKIVNIASRTSGFITKKYDSELISNYKDKKIFQRFTSQSKEIEGYFQQKELNKVIKTLLKLADEANQYIDANAPWVLAKDSTKSRELHEVCSMSLNLFKFIMTYLKPITPSLVTSAEKILNIEFNLENVNTLLINHKINKFKPMFKRIEESNINKLISKPETVQKTKNTKSADDSKENSSNDSYITIDDFNKIDLRVGEILNCKNVEGSDKLLQLDVNIGTSVKTVFSGIREAYSAESLVGKYVVLVSNLKPRKMRFGTSEGMVLAAGPGKENIWIIEPSKNTKPGMRIL